MFWKKKQQKKSKYRNEVCEYKGIKFDSKKEMERYIFLSSLQERGEISNLQHHCQIEIVPHIVGYKEVEKKIKNSTKIVKKEYVIQKAINYEPDFTYLDKNGNFHIEDVKGSKKTLTKVFQLKRKLLRAINGIEVEEIYTPAQSVEHKERKKDEGNQE